MDGPLPEMVWPFKSTVMLLAPMSKPLALQLRSCCKTALVVITVPQTMGAGGGGGGDGTHAAASKLTSEHDKDRERLQTRTSGKGAAH